MLYDCGSNLETDYGMATWNLHQVLDANFSASGKVRFIVMTGGSEEWFMESEYLYDPATDTAPEQISGEYNQIWEAYGLDAENEAYRGKMVLLDGDGLSGDGEYAKLSEDEVMSDPETLKAFINYCVANYPAEKYDLILWDHGGGPAYEVILVLVLTRAAELFGFVPIGKTDAILPVCAGDMLFNVFNEFLGFLK